jgi:hypothetical protein
MRNFGIWGRASQKNVEPPALIGQVSVVCALADLRSSFVVASLTSVVAFCWRLVNSVGARHSAEAVNVVFTGVISVIGVAFVAVLHVSKHLGALGVG